MRAPGYREDFLATLDVARAGSKFRSPEWCAAFDRLKQFREAWRKTLRKFTIIALMVAVLAAIGLSTILERAGLVTGEALSMIYIGALGIAVIVAQSLARVEFERFSGIQSEEMHVAEVILDRFNNERKLAD